MAIAAVDEMIAGTIQTYVQRLAEHGIPVWRIYLFGSHARGAATKESDIDLAVFLDQDDIDGFREDTELMRLRRDLDLRIEPHAFAKTDFDETDPYIKEIIDTGQRIV
ncbi:MAG TPA: nucleotidyltransferase domain-containing protein [Candidatus Bathyarchaeia archaeon]|nr:nucleotidyltransferase domain-containing protein [Candidatus Bathyarchaeia archaeon]